MKLRCLVLGFMLADMAQSFNMNYRPVAHLGNTHGNVAMCARPGSSRKMLLRMAADEGSNSKKDPMEVVTNVILQVSMFVRQKFDT